VDGAMIIRWGNSVPGREAKGLEVLAGAQAVFDDLAKSGRIREHREYFSITGGSAGYMIVDGELEELTKLLHDPEQLALDVKAAAVVEGFSRELVSGGTDQSIQNTVGIYMGALQEVGYL
jgi:hypothetical protein